MSRTVSEQSTNRRTNRHADEADQGDPRGLTRFQVPLHSKRKSKNNTRSAPEHHHGPLAHRALIRSAPAGATERERRCRYEPLGKRWARGGASVMTSCYSIPPGLFSAERVAHESCARTPCSMEPHHLLVRKRAGRTSCRTGCSDTGTVSRCCSTAVSGDPNSTARPPGRRRVEAPAAPRSEWPICHRLKALVRLFPRLLIVSQASGCQPGHCSRPNESSDR